jgi:EpsI family protein
LSDVDTRKTEPAPAGMKEAVGVRLWLGLAATAAFMSLAWYGTFSRVWVQWFPAWWRKDMPLLDRLTGGDSYYTHGPLVPVVAAAIAFYIYTRVGVPARRTRYSSVLGWGVLGVFLSAHLLFTFASVTFASGFALLGVMMGLVLIWGGWPLVRAYSLPIALLFFMVPLPLAWIDGINFELKLFASRSALWLASHVFGVPAVVDGSYVLLSPGIDGLPKMLVIENVCGGLRSIIALTFFAALFAALCRATGLWRWFLLLMAFPVAIACNVVRITGLVVAAHHLGTDVAGEHGWFHDLSGILVFALALGMMFMIESGVLLLGRIFKRDWFDPRLLGYLNTLEGGKHSAARTMHPGVLFLLALSAGLSLYWVNQPEPEAVGGFAKQVLPTQVDISDTSYTSGDLLLDDKVLAILETDDYVYRRFTQEIDSGDPGFDLLIVFSKNNRRGTHSPELCIQGSGEKIVSKGPVEIDTGLSESGEPLAMREVVSQDGRRMVYYLYVFKSGDTYTTNYTMQQATILLHGLLRREAVGALIRLTVTVQDEDLDTARQLARDAAVRLMPIIDENLP